MIIVSKGKNVQEAIRVGLDLLQANRHQVNIEIIEQGTKGFLGLFGSRPAVVRLIKKESPEELIIEQTLEEDPSPSNKKEPSMHRPSIHLRNQIENKQELGMVWVKDGMIFCKESPSHYPTITPKKGVLFYKNGELVNQTTVITQKDKLKVELNNELKETTFSIEVDPTNMVATLHVQPGYRRIRTLVDQEPSHHIQLEYTEKEEITNHLQFTYVTQKMHEMGINTGIQKTEIIKACETLEPGVFEIARGIEPRKGQDGWLELKVNTELLKSGPKVLENGQVDYREIQTIPNVQAGQVVAVVHPPTTGKPGITVTGEMIPPPPSKELTIQIERGADLIEGTKIVALESGKPHIERRGTIARISIIPRLYHGTDVDLASGNLHFLGDIEVQGNVEEGMQVEALGDVLIHGLTNRSTITAGNHIVIKKSVINSKLNAGKSNLVLAEVGQLLGKIADQLEGISSAIDQIYVSPAFKTSDIAKMGLSSLLRILLEKKFNKLPPLIKELREIVGKEEKQKMLDNDYREITNSLVDGFLRLIPSQLRRPEDIKDLIRKVKELHEFSLTSPEPDACIILPYALNSEIYCSGNIFVVGQGLINSNVHSGGKLQVNTMVRGGDVYAAMGADIGEAGTPRGTSTWIRVPFGQTIKIKYVMEGTNLQIGNKTYQFLTAENDVFARVDREGNLLLH